MILEQIAEDTKLRVAKAKSRIPLSQVKEMALQKNGNTGFPFEKAIRQKEIQFICEVKKASPSKGIIAQEFPYLSIAQEYEQAGAAAISVLTEPDYFKGSDQYLKEIAEEVKIPVLRKDFVVDEYMIYEAKVLGASAVLLICALLDTETIRDYIKICDELGLSALVEAHDEKEIESAILAGARIIGVNNRNLKDFTVDIKNSVRLRRLAPEDTIFVAESGIQTAEDIAVLKQAGVDAVLIGETMMRSTEKAALIQKLRGRTKVKICGLKSLEDIKMVNRHLPDYAGFVFADSKRKVTQEQAREMKAELDERILAVGVFVNEDPEKIIALCNQQIIDIVQLHGDENKEYVDKLKKQITNPIIKAIRIAPPDSKEEATEDRRNSLEFDEESADFLLFDTWEKGTYGGTGKEIADQPMPVIGRPGFLAGGLNSSNVLEKINKLHPYAVDVSSGVETDGRKDEQKVREFLETVRK